MKGPAESAEGGASAPNLRQTDTMHLSSPNNLPHYPRDEHFQPQPPPTCVHGLNIILLLYMEKLYLGALGNLGLRASPSDHESVCSVF